MKIFNKFVHCLLFMTLCQFTINAEPTVADLYGNKYANLVLLEQNIVQDLAIQSKLQEIGGFKVAVPKFAGISHYQSIELLKKQGYDAEADWTRIIESNPTDRFLIESSEKMAEKILKLKEEKFFQDDPKKLFDDIPAIKDFVESAKDYKAMVRSSGKEDTKMVSNAGGNESYANVPVDYEHLQEYVNAVIASYFYKKSNEQRLIEKDKTIRFLTKMSAFAQYMIAEKEGGTNDITQIPVGCVVYTQETYANTPGITVIQGSWGHNAGVVDNLVAVDTFLIDKNLNIRSLIRKKGTRLIPVNEKGQSSLKMIENPASIQNIPVLSNQTVCAIKVIADAIQKFYKEPTDIELVYMPHLKTIYLVQARPLRLTSNFKPSYVKSINDIDQEKIINMQTVLPADCATRKITNKNQVLVANTLNDALETFIKLDFNKDQIQAVVVKGNAETTSHAAAIFRGAEKPVFLVQDLEKFNSLLEKNCVFIDGQREIITWSENLGIVDGWFTHPMPKRVSIPSDKISVDADIKFDELPEKTFQELVFILKSAERSLAVKALNSILFKIKQRINTLRLDFNNYNRKNSATYAVSKLENIYSYGFRIAERVKTTLNLCAFDLERLYVINELEAILFQADDDKFVNMYSVESLQKSYEQEINFIEQKLVKIVGAATKNILQNRQLFLCSKQSFDFSLAPETEKLWLNFICQISESDPQTKQQFAKLMDLLNNFNALSSWINLSFTSAFSFNNDLKKYIQEIFADLGKSDKMLKNLEMIASKLKNTDLSIWTEQSKFTATMQQFNQNYFSYFISEEFKKDFQASSSFVKILVLSIVDKFVDIFDQSIKTLKGITKYSSAEDKVKNFKTMLQANFDLLNCWVHMLPEGTFKYHCAWPLDKYLNQIQNFLNSDDVFSFNNGANPFLPSSNFSVANSCIGSTTAFERNFPKTAEDLFTLLHQNILITLGAHLKINLPYKWNKPDIFAEIEHILCGSIPEPGGALSFSWLVGSRIDGQKLISRYNCPLNNHSLVFELIYDKSNNKTKLFIRFVGQRRKRWDIIKNFAEVQGKFILPVKESSIGENEVVITYDLSSKNELQQLGKALNAMIYAANNQSDSQTINEIKNLIMSFDGSIEKLEKNYESCESIKNAVDSLIFQDNVLLQSKAPTSRVKKLFEKIQKIFGASKAKDLRKKFLKLVFEKKYKNGSEEQQLKYYEKLVELGHAKYYAESLVVAKKAIASTDKAIRTEGLSIIEKLVDKKYIQSYPVAIEVCKNLTGPYPGSVCYHGSVYHVADLIAEIIKLLIYIEYKPVKGIVLKFLKEASDLQRLELCKIIVDSIFFRFSECYAEVFAEAKKAILNQDKNIKSAGLEILARLVSNRYKPAYQDYFNAIKADTTVDVGWIHIWAIEHLVEVNYKQACDLAFKWYSKMATNYDSGSLVNLLVENGYEPAYADALAFTQKYSECNWSIFPALVNHGYTPAFEPALKWVKDSWDFQKNNSWEYRALKALLNQNYQPAFDFLNECKAKTKFKERIGMTLDSAWYKTKNSVKSWLTKMTKKESKPALA